jgi:hypothetical protein
MQQTLAGATGGSILGRLPSLKGAAGAGRTGDSAVGSKIGYIRQQIPDFEIPSYRGQRYTDRVPDTLDLAERAKLAVIGLTRLTDPAVDYDVYFLAVFYRNPPVLRHETSDLFIQPKFQESLPLMRIISGSDLNAEVDHAWTAGMLKSIGPDGLYYIATEGRPWIREGIMAWTPHVLSADGSMVKSESAPLGQITNQTNSGRIIGVMTLHYLRDRNPMWKTAIQRMVGRWSELAIHREDYCYYPVALLVPGAKAAASRIEPPTGILAAEMGHRLIQGLSQYYRVSGYQPALVLARKLSHYVRYQAAFYDPQGRFIDRDPHKVQGHFHSHTFGLLGMLEYASASGDREMLEFVKQSYEWARENTYGCSRTGWYPEGVARDYRYCEGCCMADMVALAVKLIEAKAGDYWDDVDRWVRNQFAEGQMTRAEWVYPVASGLKPTPVAYNESADHPAERSLGAFLGYTTGNDYGIMGGGVMAPTGIAGCCNGNGARTIYYVWQRMVDYEARQLRVNLLLNRASAWADVHSFIPYEGRVDLKVKTLCDAVRIRMPEWIPSGSGAVSCQVNGAARAIAWQERYVNVGEAKPKDKVTMRFPLPQHTVKERVGDADYVLTLKGNTVVEVEPQGRFSPLYQRAGYRTGEVAWREVERFVSDERIAW